MRNGKWKICCSFSFIQMRLQNLVPLLVLLCAVSVSAQDTQCNRKLADLPDASELFGFRMGMTTAQLKLRVPQIVFAQADHFGVSKTSISPDFDPQMDKASLAGIRTASFDFLDDRLTSLWFGFDSSFKWKTVPDFVEGISQSLRLPDSWEPWKIRGQQLTCQGFKMTVMLVAEGPSFHITDSAAEQTIAARRLAKEEEDSAPEESESSEMTAIVADKKAKVYYLESCSPVSEIKGDNRVLFKSREEAEKAGYKLAKPCQ